MEKAIIRERTVLDESRLSGKIDSIVEHLISLKKEQWSEIEIEYHYDGFTLYLIRERSETDQEFEKRQKSLLLAEERRKKAKEKRYKKFLELKKEFNV